MPFDLDVLGAALLSYAILVASLCVHEWAHAFAAERLGDPTPRRAGRVTLDPRAHVDPIGTVALPLLMLLMPTGPALFGWAKPVPFQPGHFRNPDRGTMLVALAGPASNLVLAVACAVAAGLVARFDPPGAALAFEILGQATFLNLVLMLFNLIPIPPLDGSHVLRVLVRMPAAWHASLANYGWIVLLVLINLPPFQYGFGMALQTVGRPLRVLVDLLAG